MTENNYGQTRWSANQSGKCQGASPGFIHSDFTMLQRYYCFVLSLLLKSLLFLPAVIQLFAGSETPNMFLIQ